MPRVTDFVPDISIQYFLTRSKFLKLRVEGNKVSTIDLAYPTIPWIEVMSNLPGEPEGCALAIAIHSKDLKIAKFGMELLNVKIGKLIEYGEIYYWGL